MELSQRPSGQMDLALASTEDRIAAYMMGKIDEGELHVQDKEQMKRWLSVWQNLVNFMTPQEAVVEHFNKQKEIGSEISMRTAWADYRNATKIWGNVAHMNQKARFTVLYEYAVQVFKHSRTNDDLKEMNKAMKNLILLADRLKDGHSGINPPVLIMNINVPGEGHKSINLADLKNINDRELNHVIQDIESVEIADSDLKNMLDGSPQTDQPE